MSVCVCVYLCFCMCVQVFVCVYPWVCVIYMCIFVCSYVHVCVYMCDYSLFKGFVIQNCVRDFKISSKLLAWFQL